MLLYFGMTRPVFEYSVCIGTRTELTIILSLRSIFQSLLYVINVADCLSDFNANTCTAVVYM